MLNLRALNAIVSLLPMKFSVCICILQAPADENCIKIFIDRDKEPWNLNLLQFITIFENSGRSSRITSHSIKTVSLPLQLQSNLILNERFCDLSRSSFHSTLLWSRLRELRCIFFAPEAGAGKMMMLLYSEFITLFHFSQESSREKHTLDY